MAKSRKSGFVVKPGLNIGTNSAELDDEFLFDCFVSTPSYEQLVDPSSPKMIAAGRTGSGKTAILRRIREHYGQTEGRTMDLDPFDISLAFISNSDILQFLHKVGADLDLLFQVLWKHVFCIEYVRMRYAVKNQAKWITVLDHIKSVFGTDRKRSQALRYFEKFEGKFWVPFDENVKEVTKEITDKLEAEFAADFERFKSKINYEKGMSSEKRAEIIERCKKIVTPDQLSDLGQLITLLGDDDKQKSRYYILVDKLDENWVEDAFRFRLIRALIEALKSFGKIKCLKIVVALRSDVLERVVQETKSAGFNFQKEKYDDLICDVSWTRAQLQEFVSERIELMSKRKYDGQVVSFKDIFCREVGKTDALKYMMDRSLERPRDILSYVNLCLVKAAGKQEVTASLIRETEREYSAGRLGALTDEWKGTFPTLSVLLKFIAENGTSTTFQELSKRERCEDLVLRVAADDTFKGDPLYKLAEIAMSQADDKASGAFLYAVIEVLYRVGAVGVKSPRTEFFEFAHRGNPLLTIGPDPETRIRVHPMLIAALNVKDTD